MNKLAATLGLALLGLSVGFAGTASAKHWRYRSLNADAQAPSPGQINQVPRRPGDNGIRCIRAPCNLTRQDGQVKIDRSLAGQVPAPGRINGVPPAQPRSSVNRDGRRRAVEQRGGQ
jgi:hypothetical protein